MTDQTDQTEPEDPSEAPDDLVIEFTAEEAEGIAESDENQDDLEELIARLGEAAAEVKAHGHPRRIVVTIKP